MDFPTEVKVHSIFHVTPLKKKGGLTYQVSPVLSLVISACQFSVALVAIFQWRMIKKNNAVGVEF